MSDDTEKATYAEIHSMFGAILAEADAADAARQAEQRKLDRAEFLRRHAESLQVIAAREQEEARQPSLPDLLFVARASAESPIEHLMLRAIILRGASMAPAGSKHIAEFGAAKLFAQLPVASYRVDIALVDGGARLVVECDGREFHSTDLQRKNDRERDRELVRCGWRVIRYSGSEIHRNADGCAADALEIFDAIRKVP